MINERDGTHFKHLGKHRCLMHVIYYKSDYTISN